MRSTEKVYKEMVHFFFMIIPELGDINESRKVVSDLKLRGGSSEC